MVIHWTTKALSKLSINAIMVKWKCSMTLSTVPVGRINYYHQLDSDRKSILIFFQEMILITGQWIITRLKPQHRNYLIILIEQWQMMSTNTTHLFTVVNSMNLWDFRENFEIKHIENKSFVHVQWFHCSEPLSNCRLLICRELILDRIC